MSWRKRIKRLEDQTPRQPPPEVLEAQKEAHREGLNRLYERCLLDDDPTPRREAVRDLEEFLRERGQL